MSKLAVLGTVAVMLSGCGTLSRMQRVRTPNVCQDLTVSIYFRRDSAVVTREARAVLRGAGELARGCVLGKVDVTGLADSVGAPEVNLALSKKRADAVRQAVERLGFTTVNFSVGAVGEQGAVTPAGDDRPLRRRAEVTFHLRPH
ncbi:MAG TPA: OmpA family protein [Caulobacter sp.]|nr:OmpA family protein [Caulobacter sp.]